MSNYKLVIRVTERKEIGDSPSIIYGRSNPNLHNISHNYILDLGTKRENGKIVYTNSRKGMDALLSSYKTKEELMNAVQISVKNHTGLLEGTEKEYENLIQAYHSSLYNPSITMDIKLMYRARKEDCYLDVIVGNEVIAGASLYWLKKREKGGSKKIPLTSDGVAGLSEFKHTIFQCMMDENASTMMCLEPDYYIDKYFKSFIKEYRRLSLLTILEPSEAQRRIDITAMFRELIYDYNSLRGFVLWYEKYKNHAYDYLLQKNYYEKEEPDAMTYFMEHVEKPVHTRVM